MLRLHYLLNTPILFPGNPVVKKNTAGHSKDGGYFTSKAHQAWVRRAGTELGKYGHCDPIDFPVNLQIRFYMARDYEVDLSNLYHAVEDLLVKGGVLQDDNYKIVASHNGSGAELLRDDPHTEVLITDKSRLSDPVLDLP